MSAWTSVLRKSYPSFLNGKPEEHFLTVLHVRSTDAGTIGETLQFFLQQKQLDPRKLIGQGYDGAATLAGKIVKFISEFRSLLMKFTSTVLVTDYSSLQFRQLHQ